MAQITWKNINAPSFGEAAALYQSAGQQIGNAFQGLSGALETFKNERIDQDNRAYLTGALQAQTPEDLANYLSGQGAAIAGKGNVSLDALFKANALTDTLTGRQVSNLELEELQNAIHNRGALNEVALGYLTGKEVNPESLAAARKSREFSNVALRALDSGLNRSQQDKHFNLSHSLRQKQLAQSAAQHKERMDANKQSGPSKVNEALAKQIVGGILSNPNLDSVAKMTQLQEVINANPEMAVELTYQAQKMRSDQNKLNDQFGLTAAAEREQEKADKSFTAADALQNPDAVRKLFKGVTSLEGEGFDEMLKVLDQQVKKGNVTPDAKLSVHEMTRQLGGGTKKPSFWKPFIYHEAIWNSQHK